jgi:hypothetical protein
VVRKRAGRGRSYAWALAFRPGDPELAWLSPQGREGLDYARQLARNAAERAQAALSTHERDLLPERLTVAELAERNWTSQVAIHTLIKRARIELFGKDLSERAIQYRLQQRRTRGERRCAEPGCERPLPRHAPAHRRYCHEHRTAAARVRRHRRRRLRS